MIDPAEFANLFASRKHPAQRDRLIVALSRMAAMIAGRIRCIREDREDAAADALLDAIFVIDEVHLPAVENAFGYFWTLLSRSTHQSLQARNRIRSRAHNFTDARFSPM